MVLSSLQRYNVRVISRKISILTSLGDPGVVSKLQLTVMFVKLNDPLGQHGEQMDTISSSLDVQILYLLG